MEVKWIHSVAFLCIPLYYYFFFQIKTNWFSLEFCHFSTQHLQTFFIFRWFFRVEYLVVIYRSRPHVQNPHVGKHGNRVVFVSSGVRKHASQDQNNYISRLIIGARACQKVPETRFSDSPWKFVYGEFNSLYLESSSLYVESVLLGRLYWVIARNIR